MFGKNPTFQQIASGTLAGFTDTSLKRKFVYPSINDTLPYMVEWDLYCFLTLIYMNGHEYSPNDISLYTQPKNKFPFDTF